MSEIIFRAKEISKQYKTFDFSHIKLNSSYALNGFDMEIHRGDILGFVGANGAGKTTLIRVLAGLVSPTQGQIELFGENNWDKLYLQRRRINGIIETPALNPALTALDNLNICCIQKGIKDKGRVKDALATVGLVQQDVNRLKVRDFSLGMKQRLGIAKALLGNPEFLFLDEPLNGLDPSGIRDFRRIIQRLHQNGITVLISSHLLNELNQIATCYGFVHKGKMIEQITSDDLKKKFNKYMILRVDNVLITEKILREDLNIQRFEIVSEDTIHMYEQFEKKGGIVRSLTMKGIVVEEITMEGEDLEKYYMSIIGKK